MLQSGYINFFNINKCGLYRLFGPAPNGLELTETFTKLMEWSSERNFSATNPWDPKKHRNKTACYCHKIHKDPSTGDFLLILWKGESDKHGPLYGITVNADGTTEKAIKQTQSNAKKEMIWGRPCYYWIIPEIGCVASIKFPNSRCDSAMFQDWVTGCINYRVSLPEYKKYETEKGLVRVHFPDDEDNPFKYSFQFDLTIKTLSTASAKMTELAEKVTHIIRRETVSIKNVDKRRGWAKYFKRFEVPFISGEDDSTRQVELRIEAKPTVAELKAIIDDHAQNHKNSAWEDTGFFIENSNKTVWAGSYRLTENISVDDEGDDVFDVAKLYRKISENRDQYIDPIRKDIALINQEAANG